MTKTHEQFVDNSRNIHGNKYEYPEEYKKSLIPINIRCIKHGVFLQKPKHHLVGKGCPKCSPTAVRTKEQFLESAYKVHGDKYEYPDEYINEKTKINILCFKHGLFKQRPDSHINSKQGCPKCCRSKGTSNSAINWLKSLNISNLQTFDSPEGEYRIPETKFKVDGYDKLTNTVYEYHGTYWHGHPSHKNFKEDDKHPTINLTWKDLYNKTVERDGKIIDLGYNLVVRWEAEKNRI